MIAKRIVLLVLVMSMFTGCLSIKPASIRTGKTDVASFYTGEEGTQYFIKPARFSSAEKHKQISIDFTFRYKPTAIPDSVIMNFSMVAPAIYHRIDRLVISNTGASAEACSVELLFHENHKKQFVSRFTSKISFTDFKAVFAYGDDWVLNVYTTEQPVLYQPNKKTRKTVIKLQDSLFRFI